MMLHYSNLQFTNATCLNDPFDCHPGLIDFSNVPDEVAGAWDKEIIASEKSNRHENLRFHTWLCSLSKVNDSILMWSYYGNHKGVCVGIDMEKAYRYLDNIPCAFTFGVTELEVQYREIIDKPDYFHNSEDYYHYQLSTKAKEWEHEKEVRLVLDRPSPTVMALTYEPKDNEVIDWKEVRAYPHIGGECFESLYLGIKVSQEDRDKIIKVARKCNPDIKIFQMTVDSDAFRLRYELV